MNAHDVPVIWCLLQTTLLASLGLATTRVLMRRAPGAAATVAAAASASVLVVTLLIPAPTPRVELWTPRHAGDARPLPTQDAVAEYRAESNVPPANAGGVGIDIGELVQRIWRGLGARIVAETPAARSAETTLLALATLGAAVGVLRLAGSVRYIARLRRRLAPVRDDHVQELFAGLKQRLAVRRCVELGESVDVGSPAVIGWRRPVVLLPACRAGWTDEQLTAALAHELAHVARGDFAWRAAACLGAAIHFWHPLVHLLTRRLALAQELSADRMAAAAVGDRATYLRALSELAIRLDDSLRRRAEPLVLPTFSSGLARRIAMLRSKDGSAAEGRRSVLGVVAATAIALVGLATTALRGTAEETPTAPIPTTVTEVKFPGWPVDPATLGEDRGVCLIKPAELARHEAFVPVFAEANELCRELLVKGFPSAGATDIHLESLAYIAGEVRITVKPRTGDSDDEKAELSLGCEDFAIRFVDDIDWRKWIDQHIDGAEAVDENGLSHVRLPVLPTLGPGALLVAQRDARTLVFSSNVDRLRAMTARDGGAASYISTLLHDIELFPADAFIEVGLQQRPEVDTARIEAADLAHDPWASAMQTLLMNAQSVFVGFDLDPETGASRLGAIVGCPNGEAAESVRVTVESGRAAVRAYLTLLGFVAVETKYDGTEAVQVVGSPDTQAGVVQYLRELTENCEVYIGQLNNGMGTIQAETQAPFPKSIMTKYVPAVAAGDARDGGEGEAARR